MQLLRAVIKCNLHIKKPPKNVQRISSFFLRFISHSFLFCFSFIEVSFRHSFPCAQNVLQFAVERFSHADSKGRGKREGKFPSTLSSCRDWCVIIFMLLKKHFQCVIIKKEEEQQLQLVCPLLHLSSPRPSFPLSTLVSSVCRYLFSLHGGVRLDFCLPQFGCQKSTDRHLLFYTSCRCC